jgi:hypothetical protein
MEKLRKRLRKLQDLQRKKHEAYLATKDKANKLQKDSFRLIFKVEKAREQLMG